VCSQIFSVNPDERLYANLGNGVNRMLHDIQRETEKKRREEEKKEKKKNNKKATSVKEPPQDPFHKLDKKGEEMREMLANLSTLEWTRYTPILNIVLWVLSLTTTYIGWV